MSFVNYAASNKIKKAEEKLEKGNNNEIPKEEPKTEENDNLIYLDEIVKSNKTSLEHIPFNNFAKIVEVPRNLNLNSEQLGALTIKYENAILNSTKSM